MSKHPKPHESIYALGPKDWCFAHHISLAADQIMDQTDENTTIIPIFQDPDHGLIIQKEYSKLTETAPHPSGERRFKSETKSRFSDKKFPLRLIIPYNLSRNHFEIAVITLTAKDKAGKISIYNNLGTQYKNLKKIIEEQLKISLPSESQKDKITIHKCDDDDEEIEEKEVIRCSDGRCGDAVIAIMRLKSQKKPAYYKNLKELYQIDEGETSKTEIFNLVRQKHYEEELIERKRVQVKPKKPTKKTAPKPKSPKKYSDKHYDDSSDEETSQKIHKTTTKTSKIEKENLLYALHHESLKTLYSFEVDQYYYGDKTNEGLKPKYLSSPEDEQNYQDQLKEIITNALYDAILSNSEEAEWLLEDKDEDHEISDEELSEIIERTFSKKDEDKEFSFIPKIEEFVANLKKNGLYQEISLEKRKTSATASSPVTRKTIVERIEELTDELFALIQLKINQIDEDAVIAEEVINIIKEEVAAEIKTKIVDLPQRPTLPDIFDAKEIENAHDFLAHLRLFNRSARRYVKNLKERQSKPLYDESKISFRSGDFAKTLSISRFLEKQEITYSKTAKRYSRRDTVEKLGSYEKISDAISSIKSSIKSPKIDDSQIAQKIRSCLQGKGIKSISKISSEHNLQIEDLIINVTYLLFGTEAARNPSSILLHNMMLDLIIAGKKTFKDFLSSRVDKAAKGGEMPMSVKGAVPVARSINSSHAAFEDKELDLEFKYQYDGESKLSEVAKSKKDAIKNETTTKQDILDAEYELTKNWLKLKLGEENFNEKEITKQFKNAIKIPQKLWFDPTLQEEVTQSSIEQRIAKIKKETFSKMDILQQELEAIAKSENSSPSSSPTPTSPPISSRSSSPGLPF